MLAAALVLIPSSPTEAGADMRPAAPLCLPPKKKTTTVVIRRLDEPKKQSDPGGQDRGKDKIALAVKALDRLHSKVEEWGVATISAPIAVLEQGAFTVPNDIVPPREFYNSARTDVNASVAKSTAREITNLLTAAAQFAAPPAPKSGQPALPVAPELGTLTPPANKMPDITAPAVTTPASVISLMTPKKSPAASLRDAEDNTMRQKLYSQMSHPKSIEGYNHVVFAIVQVSCNPGWRTKQQYIADCSASLEYFDMCRNEHLTRAARREPTVFSVLPLVDAQTVEMSNSERDVTQLAFDLAASLPGKGVSVNARDIFRFVKQYSRDIRSVTPIPVVNSYSSGGTFGFRFSPSFLALADPAKKNATAGNVLLPTSFPALITVVLHDTDVRVAGATFARQRKDEGMLRVANTDEFGMVPNMAIMAHTSTRWYIKDAGSRCKRLFDPMKRDTANIEVGAAEDVAVVYAAKEAYAEGDKDEYDRSTRVGRGHFNPVYEELRREIIDLESKGLGRSWPIPLEKALIEQPKADSPELTSVKGELEQTKKDLEAQKKATAAAQKKATDDLSNLKQSQLEKENEYLKSLLPSVLKAVGNNNNNNVTLPPSPAPGPIKQASIEPPANTDGQIDERVLSLDDTLLLPTELQTGGFPVQPPPALPTLPLPTLHAPSVAPANAPHKQAVRATPELALELPKKSAPSALKPYLAQGRETLPFRR